jgi:hypothetical protein
MQWFDGGDATLTALGQTYNYTVECEYGRYRLWKVSQSWYRDDLDSTLLLKATWFGTADEAKAQAEAWEAQPTVSRTRSERVRDAAQSTRSTRQKINRTFERRTR